MSFWLDDPDRRPSYASGGDLKLDEVQALPECVEPALIHAAPLGKAKPLRLRYVFSAVVAAAAIHLGFGVLVIWSASKAKLHIKAPTDTAAMYASLTSASSISQAPSAEPPIPPAAVETTSEAARPYSQTTAAMPDDPPPAQAKAAPALQSAEVDEATLNTSLLATADVAPLHKDADNPWIHASLPVQVVSTGEKLWAAIEPCLRNGDRTPPPIRLVLDDRGRVQRMTDVEGGEAEANPELQALARAVLACGPYDQLVQGAGSYLVVAPG